MSTISINEERLRSSLTLHISGAPHMQKTVLRTIAPSLVEVFHNDDNRLRVRVYGRRILKGGTEGAMEFIQFEWDELSVQSGWLTFLVDRKAREYGLIGSES